MDKFQPRSSEEIYLSIRRRILKLELEPGQKISENQMAEEYDVSRSIIHSIFVRLNQLGLVAVYPQRGTYVTLIDLNHIENLLVLRGAVEKEAVFELFERLDEEKRKELIEKLEENIARQEQYRDCVDYNREFAKLDTEFHKSIIASVDRYSLVEMLSDPMLHMSRWRNFDVAFDKRIPALIEQHKQIVAAMKTGDFLKVQEQITIHLDTITEIRERAIAKYPQYFTES